MLFVAFEIQVFSVWHSLSTRLSNNVESSVWVCIGQSEISGTDELSVRMVIAHSADPFPLITFSWLLAMLRSSHCLLLWLTSWLFGINSASSPNIAAFKVTVRHVNAARRNFLNVLLTSCNQKTLMNLDHLKITNTVHTITYCTSSCTRLQVQPRILLLPHQENQTKTWWLEVCSH